MLTKKCSISVFALESGTSKGSELMTQIDPKYVTSLIILEQFILDLLIQYLSGNPEPEEQHLF